MAILCADNWHIPCTSIDLLSTQVPESEVKIVLNDQFPIEQKRAEMKEKKNATDAECDDWEQLVREMVQVVQVKQLVPTMRTQYMRTAFQIPFDATVRISLDTNLCMISERGYGE